MTLSQVAPQVLAAPVRRSVGFRRGVERKDDEESPHSLKFVWVLDQRTRKAFLVVLLALMLSVAFWWWKGQPRPADNGVETLDTSVTSPVIVESDTITVHVTGSVLRPGVVELPAASRAVDAINAAGGFLDASDAEYVNLARIVRDGEQLLVGPAPLVDELSDTVSLNSADASELESLSGVGPVIAARIVQWRDDHGSFLTVDELTEVPGIGPALVERIRDEVRM